VIVIGGGITGLATIEQLTRTNPELRITLLEAGERFGGYIRTERVNGLTVEVGPEVLLSMKPAAIELARRVGLGERIVGTSIRGSYVLTKRGLVRLPEGLTGLVPSRIDTFVASPLLSPLGKLRALGEIFLRPPREDADESLEHFFVRRFGREMYERLAEPLLAGISGGDGAKLSLKAMFPQLHVIERHGGFVRSMLDNAVVSADQADLFKEERKPFVSFPGGLGELVDGVLAEIHRRDPAASRVAMRTSAPVRAVARDADGIFAVTLDSGEMLRADAVIITTPAYSAAALVNDIDAVLSSRLSAIEYNSTATVSLAYALSAVGRPLDATGYVVQRALGRPVVACTWVSAKFAGRAPENRALFRLFLGDSVASSPGAKLLDLAKAEMREVMRVTADPVFKRVDRFKRAMPQYHVGHLDRVLEIDKRVKAIPFLYLAGAAYRGVGVPDCVKSAEHAATAAARDLMKRARVEA